MEINDAAAYVAQNQKMVDFGEAIKRGFQNYANFDGRASRSEFWFWQLFTFLVSFTLSFLSMFSFFFSIIGYIVTIGLFIPGIAYAWRRFHDIGKPGSFWLISLGSVVLMWISVALIALGAVAAAAFSSTALIIIAVILLLLGLAGVIYVLVLYCQPSEPQPNRFGEIPNMI